MIKIIFQKGTLIPVIICDICGKQIKDAQMGAVVHSLTDLSEQQKLDVLYAHKGACHDAAEKQFVKGNRRGSGWEELSIHLYYLCYNTGMTPQKIEEEHERFEAFGGF